MLRTLELQLQLQAILDNIKLTWIQGLISTAGSAKERKAQNSSLPNGSIMSTLYVMLVWHYVMLVWHCMH